MKEIIGAEATKLAGLQIDALQKVRSGQITLDQWERFNNLSPEDREACFGDIVKPKPTSLEKFGLFVDLGIITVPDDYVYDIRLDSFGKKNREKFYYYNENITDKNFSKATVQLTPGRKLRVKIFKQVVPGTTTSEERMAFLKSQNAVLTGAQGASLVFEQKRDELPRGYWYASFDERDALWKDAGGGRRVPGLDRYSGGGGGFDLGFFEGDWSGYDCLLCFCD